MTTPIGEAYWLAPTPDATYHVLEDLQTRTLRSLCGLRIECDRSEIVLWNAQPLLARECRSCREKRRVRAR